MKRPSDPVHKELVEIELLIAERLEVIYPEFDKINELSEQMKQTDDLIELAKIADLQITFAQQLREINLEEEELARLQNKYDYDESSQLMNNMLYDLQLVYHLEQ